MAMTTTTAIFLVALFLCFNLLLTSDVVEGGRLISEDEDFKIERQLKALNKPAIKTIHTEWGDIVDCIDIYKQPGLDHPLLKDHKIQLKPNFPLKKGTYSQTTERESSVFKSLNDKCPEGTVPIRRTTKDELIRAKSISKREVSAVGFGEAKANNIYPGESMVGLVLGHPGETYDAASANITIYNPTVAPDQFSSAEVAVENGSNEQTNRISFGWMVNPQLYGTNETRFFVRWTADNFRNTGCYDNNCAGWIQTHRTIHPGIPFEKPYSTYGGTRYTFSGLLYQDSTSKNWWYVGPGGVQVGYFAHQMFTHLNSGATRIFWGGHVKAGANQVSPPMGSGHVPSDDGGIEYEHGSTFDALTYSNTTMDDGRAPLLSDIYEVKECGNIYREFQYGSAPNIYGLYILDWNMNEEDVQIYFQHYAGSAVEA